MTSAALRKLQRAHEADIARAERSRKARDAGIVQALTDRMPQAEIMAATGLSRARLAQIKRGTR
jgi:hypothetical protein